MKFSSFAEHGFQYILVCFFLYLMLGPFIEVIPFAPVILNLFLSALLILAVYTIHKKFHMIKGSISLLTVTLVLLWVGSLGLIPLSAKAASILLCLFLCSLVYSFGQYIFAAKRVDTNLISATLCLYLILGVLWGTIYATVEAFMPGSFTGELLAKAGTPAEQLHYFYYFSYVTLTLLATGISCRNPGQRQLCARWKLFLASFLLRFWWPGWSGLKLPKNFPLKRVISVLFVACLL